MARHHRQRNGTGIPTRQAYSAAMKTSLTPEHKALIFVGCVGLLGTGVRLRRAFAPAAQALSSPALPRLAPGTPQPDLERQIAAADSAAADTGGNGRPRPRRRGPTVTRGARGRVARMAPDSSRLIQPQPLQPFAARPARGADDIAHIAGKLDVDGASAAQLDSLPGVGPALANRIVAERAVHGPFQSMAGLMRVSGVGPAIARRLDSLVTFSGVVRPLNAAPESTFVRRGRKSPAPSRPRSPPFAVS